MARKPLMFNLIKKILANKKMLIGLLVLFFGYLLLMISLSIENIDQIDSKAVLNIGIKLIPIILCIIGIGYMTFGYLEGNKETIKRDDFEEYNITSQNLHEIKSNLEDLKYYQERERVEIRQLLNQFEDKISQRNEISLDEDQTKNLFHSLKKNFSENINESFFKKMSEDIAQETLREKRNNFEYLIKDFQSIRHRLNNEVEKLGRKANVNLVIGSLTTIVALLALSYIVFQTTTSFEDYIELIYHYFPRLSLIIFIEVFAFFFLKLYKLNLADMKYFQNELTTVELKMTSIITAINFGKNKDITSIVNELSKTERNFILKKGETTVEIEKSKIDKINYQNIIAKVIEKTNRK